MAPTFTSTFHDYFVAHFEQHLPAYALSRPTPTISQSLFNHQHRSHTFLSLHLPVSAYVWLRHHCSSPSRPSPTRTLRQCTRVHHSSTNGCYCSFLTIYEMNKEGCWPCSLLLWLKMAHSLCCSPREGSSLSDSRLLGTVDINVRRDTHQNDWL